MDLSSLKNKINKLPQFSGVYVFYGKNKNIIYIGKAGNLKSRVSSYFKTPLSEPHPNLPLRKGKGFFSRPIEMMIHEVVDIKTIKTDSVLEALILESNLIKKYQPKYNVKEKDDKSFSYFAITKEEWPRVLIVRGMELDLVHSSQSTVHRRKSKNLRTVNRELRTKIIYGPYTSKKQMEIALKIMRKIFPFHSSSQKTEKGCLDFQLGFCPGPYAQAISKADYRKNIRGIKMILEGKKKNLVNKLEKEMKILAKKHEFEKAGEIRNKVFALKHIRDIALISRDDISPHPQPLSQRERRDEEKTIRIEAYDISNISGQYATGSMVAFKNSEPDKAQYRKFRIKTIQGADDVGMMREVLSRRFSHSSVPSGRRRNPLTIPPYQGGNEGGVWPMPDLILLDGGAGHLNMGTVVLESLGLKTPLAAVAKGPTRKISNFKFQISNEFQMTKLSNELKNILSDRNLIWRIMSEAHRFAVGYHRKLRKKSLLV